MYQYFDQKDERIKDKLAYFVGSIRKMRSHTYIPPTNKSMLKHIKERITVSILRHT